MTRCLVDTNVLSELRRPKPEAKVLAFIASQKLEDLFISTVTFAEIRFGIERLNDFEKRNVLQNWLNHTVRPMFTGRVLSITEEIMLEWRIMVEKGRQRGHTFSQPDLIIAATALYHGLTVATRDTNEYLIAGVPVIDPWQ